MFASVWQLPLGILAICSFTFAKISPTFGIVPEGSTSRHFPSLTAVKVRNSIQERHESLQTKHECDHHYVDHSSVLTGDISRFAKTSMTYKWPALVLEDIGDVIDEISCYKSFITLHVNGQAAFDYAKESWKSLTDFLIITSHPGCNEDGARGIYLVSKFKSNDESLRFNLIVKPVSFKEAYKTMTVSFGASKDRYNVEDLRFHNDLRRRQIPSNISYPPAPTHTPNSATAKAEIDYKAQPDQQIFTFSQSSTDLLKDTVTINCKNCSIDGIIELTEGEFVVSESDTLPFQALDFLDHGYFKAAVNGMKAHIELDTTLELSSTQTFDFSLATIAIPGFAIPGIAAVGPIFQPHIRTTFETKGTLGFGYGFDLEVPDNSSITLDIGNITRSTSQGFNNSLIDAIPLTASAPEITITLGLALRAELLLGVDILNGEGRMTAGFFFDLPALSVAISQLNGINAHCEKVEDASTVDEFLSVLFPNLTHVAPKVEIGMGVQAGARLNVPNVAIHETIGTETLLVGTEYPLPTACFSWDGEKAAFASPTVSLPETSTEAAATGDAANKTSKPNIGSRGKEIPLSGGVWHLTLVSLGVIAFSLIVLA